MSHRIPWENMFDRFSFRFSFWSRNNYFFRIFIELFFAERNLFCVGVSTTEHVWSMRTVENDFLLSSINLLVIAVGLNHWHFNFTLGDFFTNFLMKKKWINVKFKRNFSFQWKEIVKFTWISFFNCSFLRRKLSVWIWLFPTVRSSRQRNISPKNNSSGFDSRNLPKPLSVIEWFVRMNSDLKMNHRKLTCSNLRHAIYSIRFRRCRRESSSNWELVENSDKRVVRFFVKSLLKKRFEFTGNARKERSTCLIRFIIR